MYTSIKHDFCTTCYERPPVLRDCFCCAEEVVAQDRFYCICSHRMQKTKDNKYAIKVKLRPFLIHNNNLLIFILICLWKYSPTNKVPLPELETYTCQNCKNTVYHTFFCNVSLMRIMKHRFLYEKHWIRQHSNIISAFEMVVNDLTCHAKKTALHVLLCWNLWALDRRHD